MRYTVGLTGGIGSGKSSVAQEFAKLSAAVIDADAISHELTQPGGAALAPIRAAFGNDFLDAHGALDRARMRALVFADPAAKQRLEGILHPLIKREGERRTALASGPYLMLMIPLLIESGSYRERCQRILVVDCPEEEQVRRVMARSALTRTEVEAIIATQVPRAARLAAADDVIDNSGPMAALGPQVARLHQRYLDLAQSSGWG